MTDNIEFEPIWEFVNIPIDGWRDVEIAYNVLASRQDVNILRTTLSRQDAKNVVGEIRNWPKGAGKDPFDDECPILILTWICGVGPMRATVQWCNANPI